MSMFDQALNGEIKEFKALVDGKILCVVEKKGRFYYRSSGAYLPIAKSKVKPVAQPGRLVN